MRLFIIGENSRLTHSIKQLKNTNISLVNKAEYILWFKQELFSSFIKENNLNENDSILVTKSIIDPAFNSVEIYKWNFEFQKKIIDTIECNKIKIDIYFTGSVFEKTDIQNKYLDSKRKLSSYIQKNNFKYVRPVILRLNTLFGLGLPPSNMFLGQIYYSLKNKQIFKMSHGNQIRQYHHYDEVAEFILDIILSKKINKKIIEITGKEWIKLNYLANSIFSHFNSLELLKINSLQAPKNEITEKNQNNLGVGTFNFQNSIPRINLYLEELIFCKKNEN
jgi:hypothetical protein